MQVKVLKEIKGSNNGRDVIVFEEGKVYEVPKEMCQELADAWLKRNIVEKVGKAVLEIEPEQIKEVGTEDLTEEDKQEIAQEAELITDEQEIAEMQEELEAEKEQPEEEKPVKKQTAKKGKAKKA